MTSSTASAHASPWQDYFAVDFVFADFPPGARVLDIGFGGGGQMRKLQALGCRPVGIEYDHSLALQGRTQGLAVCRAQAEQLPIATASLDGLICKVVIPYTDEAAAVAEMARVLRPGAVARISYHGLGYSLRYLLTDPDWKRRLYGARVLVNTAVYRLTGRRLPGFWGDTVNQSSRRLQQYYRRTGLELVAEHPSPQFAGAPVFIYHTVRRK
jgi:SAM-dependent methyltransferase